MLEQKKSLAGRALTALLLMVGFYLLALCIVAVLIYLPYAEIRYAHRLHIKLLIGCGVGAIVILWSILPRFDKFKAPGPKLEPHEHPALFKEIEDTARKTGQKMPAAVYIFFDVNAWVADRGGFMGLGSRRIMGLGLPLLKVLSREEFRSVLAHEFGHYYSGDTSLGPWIYKTRAAIGRTMENLARSGSWLMKPFQWYGTLFMGITQAISRAQEFAADRLAVELGGKTPMISGLKKTYSSGDAFNAYWTQEVVPLLNNGFMAPLAEGFSQYMETMTVKTLMGQELKKSLEEKKADPYDSHPSLSERIAAIESLQCPEGQNSSSPALNLITDIAGMEKRLLISLIGEEAASKFKPVLWNKISDEVYLPAWRETAAKYSSLLSEYTTDNLHRISDDRDKLMVRLHKLSDRALESEEALNLLAHVFGAGLTVKLCTEGFELDAGLASKVTVCKNNRTIEPFILVQKLINKQITAESWQSLCAESAMGGIRL